MEGLMEGLMEPTELQYYLPLQAILHILHIRSRLMPRKIPDSWRSNCAWPLLSP